MHYALAFHRPEGSDANASKPLNQSHREDGSVAIQWKLKGSHFETYNFEAACIARVVGIGFIATGGWVLSSGCLRN